MTMMKRNKTLSALAFSLIAFTSGLQASSYEEAQIRNLENRVNALEQRRGAGGVINPSGRPTPAESWGIYFFGDALLWNAHVNNLPFAINSTSATTVIDNGIIETPRFDWDWGFRFGLGYSMEHDAWDVNLSWTRFFTDCETRVTAPSPGAVFPIFYYANTDATGVPAIPTAGNVRNHWRLHLNTLDLDLGRAFFVSKWLVLRPNIGLRNAWIYQRNVAKFAGQTQSTTPYDYATNSQRNNYWGIGMRTGLNTQWGLGAGVSIFADSYISLLYGYFRNNVKQTGHVANSATFVSQNVLKGTQRVGRAMLDFALGLRYDINFYDDRFHFGAQLGWENHIFWGQNQFVYIPTSANGWEMQTANGDLTLQGWTLRLRFDF